MSLASDFIRDMASIDRIQEARRDLQVEHTIRVIECEGDGCHFSSTFAEDFEVVEGYRLCDRCADREKEQLQFDFAAQVEQDLERMTRLMELAYAGGGRR